MRYRGQWLHREELFGRLNPSEVWVFAAPRSLHQAFSFQPLKWLLQLSRERIVRVMALPDVLEFPELLNRLKQSGILISPFSYEGLDALTSGAKEQLYPAEEGYPLALQLDERTWTAPRPPSPQKIEEFLNQLEAYLGHDHFRVLQSCATYRSLHFDLTLALLAGRPTGERGTASLLKLFRLPWFRTGSIPTWLRDWLLASLPREEARAQSEQVADLVRHLHDTSVPETEDGAEGSITLDDGERQRVRLRLWTALKELRASLEIGQHHSAIPTTIGSVVLGTVAALWWPRPVGILFAALLSAILLFGNGERKGRLYRALLFSIPFGFAVEPVGAVLMMCCGCLGILWQHRAPFQIRRPLSAVDRIDPERALQLVVKGSFNEMPRGGLFAGLLVWPAIIFSFPWPSGAFIAFPFIAFLVFSLYGIRRIVFTRLACRQSFLEVIFLLACFLTSLFLLDLYLAELAGRAKPVSEVLLIAFVLAMAIWRQKVARLWDRVAPERCLDLNTPLPGRAVLAILYSTSTGRFGWLLLTLYWIWEIGQLPGNSAPRWRLALSGLMLAVALNLVGAQEWLPVLACTVYLIGQGFALIGLLDQMIERLTAFGLGLGLLLVLAWGPPPGFPPPKPKVRAWPIQSMAVAPPNPFKTLDEVVTRSEWGALRAKREFKLGEAKSIVIHHTGSLPVLARNDAEGTARANMRSLQRIDFERAWDDVGVQFVISSDGVVFEGREGSLAAARKGFTVQGAHAGTKEDNSNSIGIENFGDFRKTEMPPEQWERLVELCASICYASKISPDSIVGHRDLVPTECPGNQLFSRLPELRRLVARRLREFDL
ncbi:MAG: peptidoglycan recognition family protein [Vulcanimicrobiota bacterium]